jgi:DNA-binding MarR family transcriptional regulator
MAAIRLSRLQKRILRWLEAEYQRTNGGLANSHQELATQLQHDKGNLSHSLRTLEKRGWLAMGRSPGGQAEHVIITSAGQKEVAQLNEVVNKK